MDDDDVSRWIKEARKGDEEAAQKIWGKYVQQLIRLAKGKFKNLPRRAADEDDIVQSAMKSFFRHLRGNLALIENRDELWRVLVTLTSRKVIAAQRRHFAQKRGGGRAGLAPGETTNDRAHADVELLVSSLPSPEFALLIAEECARRLDSLTKVDGTLTHIAQLKLEGYTNEEIALQLSRTTRSVERKLHRIRSIWSEDRETC